MIDGAVAYGMQCGGFRLPRKERLMKETGLSKPHGDQVRFSRLRKQPVARGLLLRLASLPVARREVSQPPKPGSRALSVPPPIARPRELSLS
jgi:hypothetical protein